MAVPTIEAAEGAVTRGQAVAAAGFLVVSVTDGAEVSLYEFLDSGATETSGYLRIGGTQVAPETPIEVAAGSLDQVEFVGGSLSGVETVLVRVQAGGEFSEWASWSMATTGAAPVVSAVDGSRHPYQSIAASALFSVAIPDAYPIVGYEFWDFGAGTGSGYFAVGGVRRDDNSSIVVMASNLGTVTYVGGEGVGTEVVRVRAADFAGYGEWVSWTMTTGNTTPVVTPASLNRSLRSGQTVSALGLINVTDGDGDAIAEYRFFDEGTAQTSGYFRLNGQRQAEGSMFILSAAQAANLEWVSGQQSGSEVVWARASDGLGYGAWVSWTMTTGNTTPVITPVSANRSVHSGQAVSTLSLIGVTDAEGDTITEYRFFDEGTAQTSGYFRLNGQRQAEGSMFILSAAQAANLEWVSGQQPGSEVVWARASDDLGYGAWASWTMTSANALPVVSAPYASITHGQVVPAASLFSVSDVDGDPITEYRFFDEGTAQTSGYFRLNGQRQPEGTMFILPAAQVANLQWVGGAEAGSELVWARASDAFGYGAWTPWSMTTLA